MRFTMPFAFFIALVLLVTWIILFAVKRKKLVWWKRAYLYTIAVYIFAMPLVAVFNIFLLIIWLVPVWPFVLPQRTFIRNHVYAVKEVSTILDAPGIALYKDYYILDKYISNKLDFYPFDGRWKYKDLQVNEAAKTFTISATQDGRDTVMQFHYIAPHAK